MGAPEFSELVGRLVEAMGQQVTAIRNTSEGMVLQTGDGFHYAFLEDPTKVSLETIRSLLAQVPSAPMKLVILTPGHLPLALLSEVLSHQGTVVDGARFSELARMLGLGEYLGEEPRPAMAGTAASLLPSARQLDEVMRRAKTWLDWGVPALALRFYRQAATMKPEFAPAQIGIGRSLLELGLAEDADRSFSEVLVRYPDDLDARVGRAAVLGSQGKSSEEVRAYRHLLEEDGRVEIRAHLIAALIEEKHWSEARVEIEAMLQHTPEDAQIRFLHAASLWKSDARADGDRERDRARLLGLSPEREAALSEHLGLPRPAFPAPTSDSLAPTRRRTPVAAPAVRRAKSVRESRTPPARRKAKKSGHR
ncbi:MAG: hypothetical protein L3K17_07745 [Thermoplasmata archaeon]|nr:hypothetical protein [Thermoplasmata archaeon]